VKKNLPEKKKIIKRVYEFYIGKLLFIKDGKLIYPIEIVKIITRNSLLIRNLLPTKLRNWKEWKITIKELRELIYNKIRN
jgi:hypothetical protein